MRHRFELSSRAERGTSAARDIVATTPVCSPTPRCAGSDAMLSLGRSRLRPRPSPRFLRRAQGAHAFVGRRLDADPRHRQFRARRQIRRASREMRTDLRCLRNNVASILTPELFSGHDLPDSPQNFQAADPADRFVGIRKMMTNVALADCAQQRVRDRVCQDIGIGMPFEPAVCGISTPPRISLRPSRKPMRVVANARASTCRRA